MVRGGFLLLSLLAMPCCAAFAKAADRPSPVVVVAAAPEYHRALGPWLDHRARQGYRIELINPQVLAPSAAGSAVDALRGAIAARTGLADDQDELSMPDGPAGYVLLVGDAPSPGEPMNARRLIPSGLFDHKANPAIGRSFASDNVYGLPDAAGRPRLAVGRWPVRTAEEVAVQVDKSLRYELEQRPGPQRRELTLLATTPNYNPLLDPMLERTAASLIAVHVGPQWRLRVLYSSPRSEFFPGPDATSRQVLRWLGDATPLTLFAGHGYDRGVDVVRYGGRSYPVLDCQLAATVTGERPGTVLWMSTCSSGSFDLPGSARGLAEALLMNPAGPTAVVAGTEETSAYANLLLCLALAHDVNDRPAQSLGEAMWRTKRALYRPGPVWLKTMLLAMEASERPECLPEDHQYLYNLLGDPTLPLRLPESLVLNADVAPAGADAAHGGAAVFNVSGSVQSWDRGTVFAAFVVDRLEMKEPLADPALLPDDESRRRAYAERFVRANDKVAAEGRAELTGGRFELQLMIPPALVPRVRWLQIYAHTLPSPDGSWSDGVAARPVRLLDDSQPTGR